MNFNDESTYIVYDSQQLVGKGTYGTVYCTNNPRVVCKTFNKLKEGLKELTILSLLLSKEDKSIIGSNVIKIHSVNILGKQYCFSEIANGYCSISDQAIMLHTKAKYDNLACKLSLNMLKYDDNLNIFNKKHSNGLVKWPLKLVMFDIFRNYHRLYTKYLIHGDIKMDNILIKKIQETMGMVCYSAVLCDFGLTFHHCCSFNDDFLSDDLQYIQTIHYRAPEVILGKTSLDYKIDMWSIGIIMYRLYNRHDGKQIMNGMSMKEQKKLLCHLFGKAEVDLYCGKIKLTTKSLPNRNYQAQKDQLLNDMNLDINTKDLLDRLLKLDPEDRISLAEVFGHPYFQDNGLKYSYAERQLDEYINNHVNIRANMYENSKVYYNENLALDRKVKLNLYTKLYVTFIELGISTRVFMHAVDLYEIYLLHVANQRQLPKWMALENTSSIHEIIIIAAAKIVSIFSIGTKDVLMSCENKTSHSVFNTVYLDILAALNYQPYYPCILDIYHQMLDRDGILNQHQIHKPDDLWMSTIVFQAMPEWHEFNMFDTAQFIYNIHHHDSLRPASPSRQNRMNHIYEVLYNRNKEIVDAFLSVFALEYLERNS